MLPPAVPIVANADKETVEVILNYLYTLLFYLGDLRLVTPDEMTAAINTALINYATVTDVQSMIDAALTPYSTTAQVQAMITAAVAHITLTGGTFDSGVITP
jgi:hypothetical protein